MKIFQLNIRNPHKIVEFLLVVLSDVDNNLISPANSSSLSLSFPLSGSSLLETERIFFLFQRGHIATIFVALSHAFMYFFFNGIFFPKKNFGANNNNYTFALHI